MTQTRILIIGGGNMGGAIARALHAAPNFSVAVVESDDDKRKHFAILGIPSFKILSEAPRADMLVLAIKPQQFSAFSTELAQTKTPLLVSIMAGITLAQLQAVCPQAVRVMPNLPAAIGESMSVLCAPNLPAATRVVVSEVFASIGSVAWVEDEQALHAVTAISGSGPAYLFAFMDALQRAAIAHGLSPEMARELVTQTVKGAALLASQSSDDVVTLAAQVASKGGTTEAALRALALGNLNGLVLAAADAASARSQALAAGDKT